MHGENVPASRVVGATILAAYRAVRTTLTSAVSAGSTPALPMNTQILILTYTAVAVVTAILTAIIIRPFGVGTWDGRGGGQSIASITKSTNGFRDNRDFMEVHMMWVWRKRWWNWPGRTYKILNQAKDVIGKEDWSQLDEFWKEVKWLGRKEPAFDEIVESVKAGGGFWNLRAYYDEQLDGKKPYLAMEIAAPVRLLPNLSFSASPLRLTQATLTEYIRDPKKNSAAIKNDAKNLALLFSENPGLQQWLRVYEPKPGPDEEPVRP